MSMVDTESALESVYRTEARRVPSYVVNLETSTSTDGVLREAKIAGAIYMGTIVVGGLTVYVYLELTE